MYGENGMMQQGPPPPGQTQLQPLLQPGAVGGGQPGPGQISLSLLIDFMVQKVYHDLVVLGELLPRKTDMERKIEIFTFASRTRMLFVRLLALVKWASSASKVDVCTGIQQFLDQQSGLLTDTANRLAGMARETLVRATLPNFHLPAAVEVLTTGSYSRVPRIIRDRIVPPETITAVEKRQVLLRLNQVIEHRLVSTLSGSPLPVAMHARGVRIENGRVTFTVDHEFEVSLTLLGDSPAIPWRLLKVKILVHDKETGEGKSLMHPMQVGYVQQLVQAHLMESPKPLHQMYRVLHSLCQSLQLEVLYTQTHKLIRERLGDHVRVEEYMHGVCLTVSYWRDLLMPPGQQNSQIQQRRRANDSGYCFSIQVDPHDPNKPLTVLHMPELTMPVASTSSSTESGSSSSVDHSAVIRSDQISLERILVHSIYVRTRQRLAELKEDLKTRLNLGDLEPTLHGSPAVLSIPILEYCLRSEQLLITVDTHTGVFLASVSLYEDNPHVQEIQAALNNGGDKTRNLERLVSQLRYYITAQRVQKTLQHLPGTSYEQLPLLFCRNTHPLKDLRGQNKMYIRLHHQPNAIVIIEYEERPGSPCEMDYRYYLLWVKPATIEDDPKDETITSSIPKVLLKALGMVEFDSFLVTHSSTTKVDVQDLSEKIIGKRKYAGKIEAPIKRRKGHPAYFLPDLARIVAFADERIPFMALSAELSRQNVIIGDVEIMEKAVGLVLKVVKFPRVRAAHIPPQTVMALERHLLSCSVRMLHGTKGNGQSKPSRVWRVEMVFLGSPVRRDNSSTHTSKRHTLMFSYDVGQTENVVETVDSILKEWTQILYLYAAVDQLEKYLSWDAVNISSLVGIRSYTYEKVVLEYGPLKENTVILSWNATKSQYNLAFGGSFGSAGMSPHAIIKDQLANNLNTTHNLALLAKILDETFHACMSLSRLPPTPHFVFSTEKVKFPVKTFTVIPQTSTHYKLTFYNTYSLDVLVKGNGLIYVRDASISMFSSIKVISEITPIPFLKTFLMKYVDENAIFRRQSQTEDDNPPSPTEVESVGKQFQAPANPSGPNTPGNPLTPSSPAAAAAGGVNSGTTNQFLQSPPANLRPQMSPAAAGNPRSVPSPAAAGSPFAASPMAVMSPSRPSPRSGSQAVAGLQSPQPGSNNPGSVHSNPGSRSCGASGVSLASRTLPQRLWAGANPTPLTQQAWTDICKPCVLQPPAPGLTVSPTPMAPLHRFLGCTFLKRYMLQTIKSEELSLAQQPNQDQGTVMFKAETLLCKVACLPSNNYQSLHLKVEPFAPEFAQQWNNLEMVAVVEKFFDGCVACPPYRPLAFLAFCRLLTSPFNVLLDIISIMRYEVKPELANNSPTPLRWMPKICLTNPPNAPMLPLGSPGILKVGQKMLLVLQLTKVQPPQQPNQPITTPVSFSIPLVYDLDTNQTSVAPKDTKEVSMKAGQHLRVVGENLRTQMPPGRCTLGPSVQDLLYNFNPEGTPSPPMGPGGSMVPNVRMPGGPGPRGPMPMGPMPPGGPRPMMHGQGGPMPPQIMGMQRQVRPGQSRPPN